MYLRAHLKASDSTLGVTGFVVASLNVSSYNKSPLVCINTCYEQTVGHVCARIHKELNIAFSIHNVYRAF